MNIRTISLRLTPGRCDVSLWSCFSLAAFHQRSGRATNCIAAWQAVALLLGPLRFELFLGEKYVAQTFRQSPYLVCLALAHAVAHSHHQRTAWDHPLVERVYATAGSHGRERISFSL